MTKIYRVGDIVTGRVTGIQPYGIFVELDENTQGLVHISEITYGYVPIRSTYKEPVFNSYALNLTLWAAPE